MKKEWYCFAINEKRDSKHTFACKHHTAAVQWVEYIQGALQVWKDDHPIKEKGLIKNYVSIKDEPSIKNVQKKKIKVNLLELFSHTNDDIR
jgi:hypothetical protein